MKQQKADRRSQRTYSLVNSAFTELLSEPDRPFNRKATGRAQSGAV